jgi:hypothetical protein
VLIELLAHDTVYIALVLQIALLDSLQKIFEGFRILSLAFEGVSDIVEQFSVPLIDS